MLVTRALLDAGELADLRSDLESTLVDPVTVLRRTATDNGGGRQSVVYAPQPPGRCPCARAWNKQSPKDMAEQVVAGQIKPVTLWYVLVAWDLDVQPSDQLLFAGMTLEVSGDDAGRTDGIGQTVICRKVG